MLRCITLFLLLLVSITLVGGCETKKTTKMDTSTGPSTKNAGESGNTAGGSLDLPP